MVWTKVSIAAAGSSGRLRRSSGWSADMSVAGRFLQAAAGKAQERVVMFVSLRGATAGHLSVVQSQSVGVLSEGKYNVHMGIRLQEVLPDEERAIESYRHALSVWVPRLTQVFGPISLVQVVTFGVRPPSATREWPLA